MYVCGFKKNHVRTQSWNSPFCDWASALLAFHTTRQPTSSVCTFLWSICVYLHMLVCVCKRFYVFVCALYIYRYLLIVTCVCMYLIMFTYIWMCFCVFAFVCTCVNLFVCDSACVFACVYTWVCACQNKQQCSMLTFPTLWLFYFISASTLWRIKCISSLNVSSQLLIQLNVTQLANFCYHERSYKKFLHIPSY